MTSVVSQSKIVPFPNKRELSQSDVAIRKRRSRARHRKGHISVRLDVPLQSVEAAIRQRDGLPDDAVISRSRLLRTLRESVNWWAGVWGTVRR